ncbi:hypothetical protein P4U43_11575 [Arthrobacter sp. EH-1B-1]|uniref:Uncharacterized protein n=1 Tax=Arthrobacter vasquezii TaxID=2977629 RepID=A0ABT6CX24_9MICC|nr:hypothetical protein [Arthrobacter vasquezii]MDF9278428.1 hypothetical protein [Arthrobacter vasquezii]
MNRSRPPTSERQRKAILDAVLADGDVVEHHYLEVKGSRPLTKRIW